MHECQQDAMVYVRKYGHPDLFITMINWPAIKNIFIAQTKARGPSRIRGLCF